MTAFIASMAAPVVRPGWRPDCERLGVIPGAVAHGPCIAYQSSEACPKPGRPPNMPPHTVYDALQLAVSPVILISAYGLLLLSLTNRLGRAIDRGRLLRNDDSPTRDLQLRIITKRAKWIRQAILFMGIAIFLTALLVLALFLSVILGFEVRLLVSGLFILSVSCLGVSLWFFLADIFGSLRALEANLDLMSE